MNCCFNDEKRESCSARRMPGLPMCQFHMIWTFREALVEGMLPNDVFAALCRGATHELKLGYRMQEIESRQFLAQQRIAEEQARRETIPPRLNATVYYVQLTGDRIKIGWTTGLNQRLATFRLRAEDVLAIEPGDQRLEAARHKQFAHCRIGRTEEFTPDDALMRHIENLRVQTA